MVTLVIDWALVWAVVRAAGIALVAGLALVGLANLWDHGRL